MKESHFRDAKHIFKEACHSVVGFSFGWTLINIFDCYSGHCKKLAPEYAGAAAVLAAQDPPMYIAKCDTTENNALGERFEIKGFPTLVFFR